MGSIITDLTMPKVEPTLKGEGPGFADWRARNDAVMAPDKGFTKQLKMLDPDLEVVWDWGAEKWEIWRFPKDREGQHIMTIQTKDKSYRELGTDILLKLQHGDTHRYTTKELCDYLEELDRQTQRRKEKDFKNLIHSMTLDTFNYARGVLQVQVPQQFRVGRIVHAED